MFNIGLSLVRCCIVMPHRNIHRKQLLSENCVLYRLFRKSYVKKSLFTFLPKIMIICVLKRILHKEKVIFIQLLESPILPYGLLLLCYKIGQQYRGGRKGIKNIFEIPNNEIQCLLSIKESIEKMGHNFHIRLRSGPRGLITRPPLRSA